MQGDNQPGRLMSATLAAGIDDVRLSVMKLFFCRDELRPYGLPCQVRL